MSQRNPDKTTSGVYPQDKTKLGDGNERHVEVDPHHVSKAERAIFWKADLRLIPILGFIYGCSLIDRSNLPNARLAGMNDDLQTNVGDRYSIISMMFFPAYILTEIPGNYALKRGVHPRYWISGSTFAFGLVMVGFGFAPNWWTLAILRLPLGAFEGLMFPAVVYLISSWYPRYETQKRMSTFYMIGQSLSGFGNAIAYGFSLMAGLGGLNGWSWVFIMMGLMTVVAAAGGMFVIPHFPGKATFVTEEERHVIQSRINADRGDFEEERMNVKVALRHMANWRIWCIGLIYLCSTLPAYAFSLFLALILNGMGFSVRDSQLLCLPPYAVAVSYGFFVGWAADKVRMRGPFIIGGALLAMIGCVIVGWGPNPGSHYVGSFFAIAGCQSNIPTVLSWSVNNVRGYGARAISSAIVVAAGGIGGIIAGASFRQQDASTGYRPGLWTTIAAQLTVITVSLSLMWYFRRENQKAERGEKVIDNLQGYRYTL